jgi:hypothetical protein
VGLIGQRERTIATALCALALFAAGNAVAQTTTDVRNFEVISVDGNYLVVRDQIGTHEYNVPADFRFMVDGKSMAVGDLKPGMKGPATITKTTTVRPVTRARTIASASPRWTRAASSFSWTTSRFGFST